MEDAAERYELLGSLGQGGMGRVLRARDRALGREVALKLVSGGRDPARLERFQREGELAARLDHPGVVRVHSAGLLGGEAFLAYELVDGARPLDEAFRGTPLPRRVGWVLEAARALGHAHARGVVHRDVKPGNVLVDAAGRVRVTDFGLARASGVTPLTREGTLLGTPLWAPPEAFDGRPAGPPGDVWGLGVLLYQALTGELPFEGNTLAELGTQVSLAQPRPPRELNRSVSPALEEVCLRTLVRAPERRPPDATAFAQLLEVALQAPPPRGVRRRRARWALAGLTVVAGAVLALAALLGRERKRPAPVPVASEAAPTTREVPPLAPAVALAWTVTPGDATRSWLAVQVDRGGDEDGASFHYRLELDLAERVDARTPEALWLTVTVEQIRMDLTGDVTFPVHLHTERLAEEHPMRRILLSACRVELDPRSGAVRSFAGLDERVTAILDDAHGATRDMLEAALEPMGDLMLTRYLELLWDALPPEPPLTRPAWRRPRAAWISRNEGLEIQASHSRRGDEITALGNSGRALALLPTQRAAELIRFDARTRWAGGRVEAAEAVLDARESWSGRAPSSVSWRLEYRPRG